jgi:hypothetical protein
MKTIKKEKFSKNDPTLEQGKGVPDVLPAAGEVKDPAPDFKTGAKEPNGEIKTLAPKHEKTKTEAASEVVLGSSGSMDSGSSLLRGVSFGGGAGENFANDVSATTKAENAYRSGSRVGKRLDPITRKIDFNYPELFKIDIKQSKPLAESSEKQGYPGNYQDEHVFTAKVSGGAPADPTFSRSVDFIAADMVYFGSGQYNRASGVDYDEYGAMTYNTASTGNSDPYSKISITKGSYMPKDLTVTFNANGAVGFAWSEDDLANKDLTADVVRLCADHSLRQLNQLELDRLNMVSKAGNESDPSWCPYGDAIVTATQVNHILKDVDELCGNNVFASRRKLKEALAFQVNKAAKDGIRLTGPMTEMLNGNIQGAYSSAIAPVSETNGNAYWRRSDVYAAGGAGLWLAVNDSLTKYSTKGKLLTLPLSFKNALNIADSNDGDFRVNDTFYKDICHSEMFSTIDAGYDPVLPVCITDKLNVVNSMSLAGTGNISITADTTAAANALDPIMTIHYENLRNRYNIPVYNFFVQGLHDYFKANWKRYWDQLPEAVAGIKTLTIPVQSSVISLSLWDLIVCSATPFMVPRRQKTLVDIIKYTKNFGYPYTGSTPISSLDVDYALNYTVKGIDEGIDTKICNPVDAIKFKFPEVFWTVTATKEGDDHVTESGFVSSNTVLPHYFNQDAYISRKANGNTEDTVLILSDNPSTINYPSTRCGVMLSDMDTIYGMTEEDYRLALDRMVVYPAYGKIPSDYTTGPSKWYAKWTTTGTKRYVPYAPYTYKYGMTGDGIPTIPYIVSAELTGNDANKASQKARCLTILDVMKTPRELGLHFVAPSGVLTPVRDASTGYANYRATDSGYLAVSGPGFTAYIYKQQGQVCEDDILANDTYAVTQGAAYSNDYVVYQTTPSNAQTDFGFTLSLAKGIIDYSSSGDHTYILDAGSYDFTPFVEGSYNGFSYDATSGTYVGGESQTSAGDCSVVSLQKYFWTRLQRLPFVVNPFDANASDFMYATISSSNVQGNKYDLYDFLYFFGFCGFRTSDFTELTYERNKQRISLGMNYVNDPYIEKTALLK